VFSPTANRPVKSQVTPPTETFLPAAFHASSVLSICKSGQTLAICKFVFYIYSWHKDRAVTAVPILEPDIKLAQPHPGTECANFFILKLFGTSTCLANKFAGTPALN
jgi:hypothetical protein